MWSRLVFKEIWRRKWGFLFSALAVAIAIGVWVLIDSVTAGLDAQVTRITTGQMQQNILIVPAGVPEDRYFLGDFGDETLPEWIVDALLDPTSMVLVDTRPEGQRTGGRIRIVDQGAAALVAKSPEGKRIRQYQLPQLADHYVAELQSRAEAQAGGRTMKVVMTGQRQEAGRKSKTPITVPPPPGKANLGASVARNLKVKVGDTITVAGSSFAVHKIEEPQSSLDDIRVYLALRDAQKILNLPGKVNRVVAISCICEMLTIGQLAEVLELHVKQWSEKNHELVPVRVTPMARMAQARLSLRGLVEQTKNVLAPLLALLCAALVGGYFYFNVRERQHEMGVMLAIGFTPGPILLALVAKIALIGLLGWAGGMAGGAALAVWLGPSINIPNIAPAWDLWPRALLGAGALTLLAGLAPVIVAMRTEAAHILRNS